MVNSRYKGRSPDAAFWLHNELSSLIVKTESDVIKQLDGLHYLDKTICHITPLNFWFRYWFLVACSAFIYDDLLSIGPPGTFSEIWIKIENVNSTKCIYEKLQIGQACMIRFDAK